MDENISYNLMKKEVNMSIIHHKEDKKITKLFCIMIQVKDTKVYTLFDT